MAGFKIDTRALNAGMNVRFGVNLVQPEDDLTGILCEKENSDSAWEDYFGANGPPQLTPWDNGPRTITTPGTRYQRVINTRYQAAIGIERESLEDDRTGEYLRFAARLGARASMHPTQLLIDVLEAGGTAGTNAYDGVSFFNNAHPAEGDGPVIDNDIAGTGSTTAAIRADLSTVRTAFRRMRDEANQAANQRLDLVVVAPPELEDPFTEALTATLISNTSNVTTRGKARLIISNDLADTNDWYAFNVGNIIKPLLFQTRLRPTPESVTGSEMLFHNGTYYWGIRARYRVAPFFFRHAIRVTNA